jgi:hypothetical protein
MGKRKSPSYYEHQKNNARAVRRRAEAPERAAQYQQQQQQQQQQQPQQEEEEQEQDVVAPVPSSPGPFVFSPDDNDDNAPPDLGLYFESLQRQSLGGPRSDQRVMLEVTPTENPTTAEDADVGGGILRLFGQAETSGLVIPGPSRHAGSQLTLQQKPFAGSDTLEHVNRILVDNGFGTFDTMSNAGVIAHYKPCSNGPSINIINPAWSFGWASRST